MSKLEKFVLFPLGPRRFAFKAEQVAELAKPDTLHAFPHTTPLLSGVLLRRGNIIPVMDVANVVLGPDAPVRKFYLIVNRGHGRSAELTAVPVTGECELISSELLPPTGRLPGYVSGLLSLKDDIIEVLDLDKVAATGGMA